MFETKGPGELTLLTRLVIASKKNNLKIPLTSQDSYMLYKKSRFLLGKAS